MRHSVEVFQRNITAIRTEDAPEPITDLTGFVDDEGFVIAPLYCQRFSQQMETNYEVFRRSVWFLFLIFNIYSLNLAPIELTMKAIVRMIDLIERKQPKLLASFASQLDDLFLPVELVRALPTNPFSECSVGQKYY